MADALEARQEAHSIWDAAGDRYRSGETHRCLSHLHCGLINEYERIA
jgi:hypothetical protein